MIKNNRGITVITLSIAVIIILIVTGMLVYSAKDSIYVKNLTNMQNDISNLRDKISLYYSQYGALPASTEFKSIPAGMPRGLNDTGRFLIIDLQALDGLTLNYGKDYEKYKNNRDIDQSELIDIYIINENSHNIFYVQGVGVNENGTTKMYYTDYTEGDKEAVEIIDIPEEIPQIPIPFGFYYVGGTEEKGIVISDDLNDKYKYADSETVGTDLVGNQYVWIPVDGILGENGTTIDDVVNNGKILLGRYEFSSDGTPSECISSKYKEETQEEHTDSKRTNAIANDIEGFIDSVRKNGGYYFARYEASYGKNEKANSKVSETFTTGGGIIKEGKLWNIVTQWDASKACQDLYPGINSDLMNSYAWDTAIIFIQRENKNYANQTSLNVTLQNTGTTGDVKCNIYDMASNCYEFTTESNINIFNNYGCVLRGGNYSQSKQVTGNRIDGDPATEECLSFRPILYLE